MNFQAAAYGDWVLAVLALDGGGQRFMPLVSTRHASPRAALMLKDANARKALAGARAPEAALAGLWLYHSGFEEAHRVAQEIPGAEGSYWHAILHRQEPDAGNSAYWFQRVGQHRTFDALNQGAAEIVRRYPGCGFPELADWDPFRFIDFVEEARRAPGSTQEKAALEIQLLEWQLLFDHCARPL